MREWRCRRVGVPAFVERPVGEDDLQEVSVVEPIAAGECDALGQGVEHPRFRAFGGAFHNAR